MPETSFKQITAIDWSSKLGSLGAVVEGLDDIRQCISIILGAQKGSLPHRPKFGSDLWKYIDLPAGAAKPHIIREAAQAVARWEKRAEVQSISLQPTALAHYILVVTWKPADDYDAEIIKQEVLI